MSKRIVDNELWKDSKFRREMRSIKCRFLWLYLLTCPSSQSIGIFYLPIEEIALHTRLDEDEIKQFLMVLTDLEMCEYDIETEEIVIYNYPKYNICSWGKPMVDKINSELSNVKKLEYIEKMIHYLKDYVKSSPNDKKAELMERVIPLYENALKPVAEKEKENTKDKGSTNNNINNNININNVSCHDTSKIEKLDNVEIIKPEPLSAEEKAEYDDLLSQLDDEE